MHLCRFHDTELGAQLGVVYQQTVYNLSSLGHAHLDSLTDLLHWSCDFSGSLGAYLADVLGQASSFALADLDSQAAAGDRHLLKPIEHQEVWAAGVTYERSRKARRHESKGSDIYDRIYAAERPEIFLKATPHRVVGNGETLYIRGDSRWMVPEPELAVLFDPALQVVGYTVANDLSARDIEGENPLYLAQAKIYSRCCAVGPTIILAEHIEDVTDVKIELRILRGGDQVFAGETSTARMTRSIDHLTEFLARDNDFPDGVYLLTGTGVVPPDEFTLDAGDRVVISVEEIGTLSNDISYVCR
jgi:2-dehydro-3-deoxy-D-arabinonate dehydratase